MENKQILYRIPENFIAEGRILRGRIRVRYLADAVLLGTTGGLLALLLLLGPLQGIGLQPKVSVAVFLCGPGVIIGMSGFNGDPISLAFINYMNWKKIRTIRIYNSRPRMQEEVPLKIIAGNTNSRDKAVRIVDTTLSRMRENRTEGELVAGEDFEFVYDPSIDGYECESVKTDALKEEGEKDEKT